ncbi:hypothetical protein [Chitinophaga sp. Cy-1792]|uniref:hypothetical protein n=1 Tax=Chitinophaga sp. Cy-1792 TaxID=2608339 RepID=UPI0014207F5A|nr:hypothetical protein [Chitinophaga sp. Cy-1792]NIG54603.1 hypothetical protein [Chitinophaga sp. Cy-1792]
MKIVYLLLLLVCCMPAYAQQPAPLSIEVAKAELRSGQTIAPAPEAAELGKYANAPVSLYTGTPDITVPIYTLQGNNLSIELSLHFDASGFRPQDAPTWVGQNWSLFAGGVITRVVRGNPDDARYTSLDLPPASDYFAWQNRLQQIKKGEIEMEPDLYYYNFDNYTGKFIRTPSGQIVMKMRNMMDFHFDSTEITVTDDKGNRYRFADIEATRMEPGNDPYPDSATVRSYNYISSWYLTSIIAANSHEKLLFGYDSTVAYPMDLQNTNSAAITHSYATIRHYDSTGMTTVHTIDSNYNAYTGPFTYSTRRFLKKISLVRDDSIIAFIALKSTPDIDSIGSRQLDTIAVYNAIGGTPGLVKQFRLGYGYFSNPDNSYTKRRLRLDSLQEIPIRQDAAVPPPYQFFYNTNAAMPERFTKSIDHWGFYNCANNQSLVPNIKIISPPDPSDSIIGGNANREPNLTGSSYAMINKIIYPTGGFTSLEYELHTTLNQNESVRTLGGVRIKTLADYAFPDIPDMFGIVKAYTYTDDIYYDKSSGRSDEAFPAYLVTSSYTNRDTDTLSGDYFQSQKNYTVTANGSFGLGSFQGKHVGYLEVTEKIVNNRLPATHGRTLLRYQLNNISTTDDDIANGSLIWWDMYNYYGAFKYEVKYTYLTNTINTYASTQAKPVLNQTNAILWCKTLDSAGNPVYNAYTALTGLPAGCTDSSYYPTTLKTNTYGFKSQEKFLTLAIEKRPDDFTSYSLTTNTKYMYGNPAHIYPTQIERYSDHIKVVTRKKYIADYPALAGANDAGIPLMLSKHYLAAEVENYQYRAPNSGPDKRVINGTISYYGADLLPVKQLSIAAQKPITNFQESALTTSGLTFDPAYQPAVYFTYQQGALASRQNNAGPITRYLRGYNNSYTVAEMTGGNKVHAAYYNFEDDGQSWYGSQITGYTINNSVAYAGQRSAIIPAGGMITIPSSPLRVVMKLSFWLYSGGITAKQGLTTITPFMTGPVRNGWTYYEYRFDPADGSVQLTGNNTIIDELRYIYVNADIITYTYDPLIGKTSSNSANNRIIFYEYDGLNRLINLKDEQKNILQNFKYNYGPGIPVDIPH